MRDEMPRPNAAQRCSRTDPRVKCVGRWDAVLRGEFLYSFRAGGYVWNAFGGLDGGVVWKACPWCQEPLPNRAAIYRRLKAGIEEDAD